MDKQASALSRRDFLRLAAAVPASLLLSACGVDAGGDSATATAAAPAPAADPTIAPVAADPTTAPAAVAESLAPTPACGDDDDEPTLAQTEGPFYTPNTPQRTSLREPGIAGAPLLLTGTVLSTGCRPVAGALLDFWHCDDAGNYDNAGFTLRGHQFADEEGRFTLETIVPGLYPGRTRHIHVKVQAPDEPVLTTQLYFPGEPDNARDGIFHPDLVMSVAESADGQNATFDFVLDIA
jgi:protocatechuate 3,4-dioxygenase beta subunit